MKFIPIFLVLAFLSSCRPVDNKQLCLANLKYTVHHGLLVPPTVTLEFKDDKGIIAKAMNTGSFQTLFFYTSEKGKLIFGDMKQNYYKKNGDLTQLYAGISYFQALDRMNMTKQQIEGELMKEGLGMVIGKDTIVVKPCNDSNGI